MNKKVALCLIVKNEEKNIIDCLDSLKGFYDTAFITDTGSNDNTVQLLENREDVVISNFEWIDDFAAARNFNLSQVSPDFEWIVWCDADDRIIDENANVAFRNMINNVNEEICSINLPYVYSHNTQASNAAAADFQYYRKRAFKNGCCQWKGFIHEYPSVIGQELQFAHIVFHHFRDGTGVMNTKRNLRIFQKRLHEINAEDKPRYTFYYAKELTYNGLMEEAEEQFLEYIPISKWAPEKARAIYELASIYEKRGSYAEARKWCFKCITLEPHNSDAFVLLSKMSYNEGDYISSSLWAHHAINSDEEQVKFFDYIPNRTWVPLELLAWSNWKLGKKEEAISSIKEALKYIPKSKHINRTLECWLEEYNGTNSRELSSV